MRVGVKIGLESGVEPGNLGFCLETVFAGPPFHGADTVLRYLGRPRTETVVARPEVVRAGRQPIVVECRVTDDEDHLVAVADFSMIIVPVRAPLPEAGAAPATGEHLGPQL